MGIIGVCFGNAQSAIMIDKIALLDQFLRDHELRAMLAISPQDEASELHILADFRHLRVDGIVLIQSILSAAHIRRVLANALCVHVEPADPELLPSVTLDRGKAMGLIIDHLVGLGHRSFGVLGFSPSNRVRWEGIVRAMHAHGLNPDTQVQIFELETAGLESYSEGIQVARLALQARKRSTAYIAINDRVAAGAMQEMRDAGYSIPKDFSVVGFDNLTQGRYLRPTITTIDQQPQLLIAEAGRLLLELLGKTPEVGANQALSIEPLLIIRESTGPAPRRVSGKK